MAKVERYDRFIHRRHGYHICVVNFVSVTGDVNYRIKGQRHSRTSTEKNFLKNWTKLNEPEAGSGDNDESVESSLVSQT